VQASWNEDGQTYLRTAACICCLASSSHYRANTPPPAARDDTGRYAQVFQLNVMPLVELLTSHHCHHPVLITPICFFFLFGFESTQSAPQLHQDSGTHTDGGAAIRKPGSACHEGTPAMDLGHMNVILK